MDSMSNTHSLGKRNAAPVALGLTLAAFVAIGLLALFSGWIAAFWAARRQRKQAAKEVEAQPTVGNAPQAPAPAHLVSNAA
ncbi:hypothetical protein GGR53DRAFT_468853 [Hypoxylon sp. FL1150]|nr:hypothetical protein GGR53DRAFT_468853 [Hypoxylon sp. FL1150]